MDIYEKLEQLKKLLDEGAITHEENMNVRKQNFSFRPFLRRDNLHGIWE